MVLWQRAVAALFACHFVDARDALVDSQLLKNPYPYHFPELGSNGTSLFPMPLCHGFRLEEATIDELQAQLTSGRLTSVDLVECYTERIFQTNGYVNAVSQTNPDALKIARALDVERARGRVRGPLHGIPFLVKDNIATRDRLETTAGSWALQGSVVPRDAHVAYKLRKAGALLLGKAAMSEWAEMRTTDYSQGYSAFAGQSRSAYNFTVNPGGSSSGSGIAVSINQAAFALGTETDGSVVQPAERNAIVGIKPTVGLTSRAGVIPISSHQDSVGTLGKTVRDATYVLDAIYGIDKRDNYTFVQRGKTPRGRRGYSQFLTDKTALKGAVFGIPWNSYWKLGEPSQISQLLELVDLIKSAGATIVNGTEITNYETIIPRDRWDWDWGSRRGYANESEYTIMKVDFYNDLRAYLSELENTNIRSLEDVVQYNYDNSGTEGASPHAHPAWAAGQDSLLASLATKGIQNETYWQAVSFCRSSSRKGINDALSYRNRQLDGLLVPTDVGQTWMMPAQAGYPMISIPAGLNVESGMPFGLAIMHTAFSEAKLIRYASAIEDLQNSSGTNYRRTQPQWLGYRRRNLPLANAT
ncbi:conserved hypothetical protein [Uncinocarpus reesii 1704]|uniref:Amidase domain-containing protein n=1 Tax=Uncinocarpus reesii (strain UAMH 1704) TaxID=336963 RepID=C4JGN4_UNCRE|nr:uncharacterized protein UREG_02546 [Uncinocarpus reesii 1704]EEP77697.1 conserved hypothetical protein [Uncinocarpus reesii 1704]